jgi:NAD(P)-dependent dehydrogenase (short-subunit alcohol dehydrogenase family)
MTTEPTARRFEGKVAFCAGSATGMGAATALRLAAEGAKVMIGDVNVAGAQTVIDQIVAHGGQGAAVSLDIVDEVSVTAAIAETVARFGGLDVMHVNATDRQSNRQDFDLLSTDLAVFDRMHAVSLRGHMLCARAAIPEMLKRGGGAFVHTSSDAAKSAAPSRMSYYITKAGLNAMTRHVATRWGREGIRSNAICPGTILTDAVMINTSEAERAKSLATVPSPRLGSVDDIATLVAFLLSDEAGWINGQAVSVNGGGLMVGG